jgi:beta-lactamase regulating signal transducer with metallopeptidase domain
MPKSLAIKKWINWHNWRASTGKGAIEMSTILGVLSESSVRAIIIAAAIALVLWGMRMKSPAICHRAYTGVLMAMLLLPFLSVWAPKITIPLLPAESGFQEIRAESFVPQPDLSSTDTGSSRLSKIPPLDMARKRSASSLNIFEIAGILYFIGFGLFIARLLAGMVLSYRLVPKTQRNDKGFYCSRCSAPLTIGLLHPCILLPMASRNWDTDTLAAVLTHEREHVRRRDPLVEWLAVLNRSIYWFNPLAWWLCRKLATLAEQACDEAVIANGCDRGAYAELLLELARSIKQRGGLVTAWGSSIQGSALAPRIRRILTAGFRPSFSRTRLVLVTVLCVAAALVPVIFELSRAQAAPSNPPAQPAFSTSPPSLPNPSHTTLYKRGLALLEKREFNEARLAFQALLSGYPESPFAAWAYLAIGESFYNEGGTENLLLAEEHYRDFVVFFPTNPKTVDAWMKILSIDMQRMRTRGFDKEAILRADAEIDTFLKRFPKSAYTAAVRRYREEVSRELARLRLTKITGYVADPMANAIEGVMVILFDDESNEKLGAVYSNDSYFVIRGVPLDKHIGLRFQKDGFETCSYAGADLQHSPLSITMHPHKTEKMDLMDSNSFEQDLLKLPLIERIDFRGNRRIPEATLRFYIQSKPGAPYDKTILEFDIRALYRTNFFESIEIQEKDGDIGKILAFIVKEKPLSVLLSK